MLRVKTESLVFADKLNHYYTFTFAVSPFRLFFCLSIVENK